MILIRTCCRRYITSHRNFTSEYQAILPSTRQLFEGLKAKDRFSLSKAITLVESTREDHRIQANHLISMVLQSSPNNEKSSSASHNAHRSVSPGTVIKEGLNNNEVVPNQTETRLRPAFRVGVSGPPGVGKSTFLESFGMELIRRGHSVAILAIDPSSSLSGGSILGDKTRMPELSRSDHCFIRGSPSGGALGGVGRCTGESIMLCEAAGYDVVLVETVGVGQSETLVSEITDLFTLLVQPGSGDELQGIKKGIVELADMVVINKSDGNLKIPAQMTQLEYVSALKLIRTTNPLWKPPVLKCSSIEQTGIPEIWESMKDYYKVIYQSGEMRKKRAKQRKQWMWRIVTDEVLNRLKQDEHVKRVVQDLEAKVTDGTLAPGVAAEIILKECIKYDPTLTEKV